MWRGRSTRTCGSGGSDGYLLVLMCHYLSGTEPSPIFARFCCGHLEAAEVAQTAGAGKLVITHITSQFDKPGLRERVVREIGARFGGEVVFGEDLMRVPVAPSAAARLD